MVGYWVKSRYQTETVFTTLDFFVTYEWAQKASVTLHQAVKAF
jgi:hypothetical protein